MHEVLPMLIIPIFHVHGDGGTEGLPEANPGKKPHLIPLNLHPPAPAVTSLPPPQIPVHVFGADLKAGGEALHHGGETGAVAFARGQLTSHPCLLVVFWRRPQAFRVSGQAGRILRPRAPAAPAPGLTPPYAPPNWGAPGTKRPPVTAEPSAPGPCGRKPIPG